MRILLNTIIACTLPFLATNSPCAFAPEEDPPYLATSSALHEPTEQELQAQLLSIQASYNNVLLPMINQYMDRIDSHHELCKKQANLNLALEKKNNQQWKHLTKISANHEVLPELTHCAPMLDTHPACSLPINQQINDFITPTINALLRQYSHQEYATPRHVLEKSAQCKTTANLLQQLYIAQGRYTMQLEFLLAHMSMMQRSLYLYYKQLSYHHTLSIIHKAQENILERLHTARSKHVIEHTSSSDSDCTIIEVPEPRRSKRLKRKKVPYES